mgnify:FL=1
MLSNITNQSKWNEPPGKVQCYSGVFIVSVTLTSITHSIYSSFKFIVNKVKIQLINKSLHV